MFVAVIPGLKHYQAVASHKVTSHYDLLHLLVGKYGDDARQSMRVCQWFASKSFHALIDRAQILGLISHLVGKHEAGINFCKIL